jgi:hypothetical protein
MLEISIVGVASLVLCVLEGFLGGGEEVRLRWAEVVEMAEALRRLMEVVKESMSD